MNWERRAAAAAAAGDQDLKEVVMDQQKSQEGFEDDDDDDASSESTSSMRRQQQQLMMMLMTPNNNNNKKKGSSSSLRVLLIEGDDSTRHIIAALLRKCNYKVDAASDGLKAWEMLKERPGSIDVVLTEVELPSPSFSGITLLSTIMDHEACKNIPVIMMSSHDSINMVFKCMLKGAADFLVKPIRKNELRNLWQHVWRRRNLSDGHGDTNVHKDDDGKKNLETNPRKANQLSGFVPTMKNKQECSEKGSDEESHCIRSDMEAESTCNQNSMVPQQTTCRGFSFLSDTISRNGEENIQPIRPLLDHESKNEDKSFFLGSKCSPFNGASIGNEQLLEEEEEEEEEEEYSCALVETTHEDAKPVGSTYHNILINEMEVQTCDQAVPPKQIIDLIGSINNQPRYGYGLRENSDISNPFYGSPEFVFCGEDFSCKSRSAPLLELSLRRYPQRSNENEEKKESSTLNHSDFSPFSLYNSKPAVSTLSRKFDLQGEGEDYCNPSTKQIPDKGFENSSSVPRCYGITQHLNTEDAISPSHNAIAIKCSPIRGIPVHIPVPKGMQSVVYPESSSSAHLFLGVNPTKGQETFYDNSSHQSCDVKEVHTSRQQHPHNQSLKSSTLHSAEIERCHVTSVTGDSASSSICDSAAASHVFNAGNANICTDITAELQKKPTDLYRLSQREAALNKFRLKRKDRCYEKKVRYQSRKRLAEQRPRVKGQFVRHSFGSDGSGSSWIVVP